jgi:predicted negative regulator of RcsB-dependent stress response
VPGNITRKELKQDKFAVEVAHGVDYFSGHRKNFILYGGIALVVIAIAAGVYYYRGQQATARNQELGVAIALSNAPVAPPNPSGSPTFSSPQAKVDGVAKAFQKVMSDYPGSQEAYVAEYLLASQSADAGKLDDATKKYQDVIDHADANYASLAKLALAQIDYSTGKQADAEKLLKDLMDHPTDLVSKPQATISYAKIIGASRPDEARKLLTGLLTPPSEISQVASAALQDLPQK